MKGKEGECQSARILHVTAVCSVHDLCDDHAWWSDCNVSAGKRSKKPFVLHLMKSISKCMK